MNFCNQVDHIIEKTSDRINLLKSLSFNKTWSLPNHILVQLYKSLLRSVIEYSSFMIVSLNKNLLRKLEVLQNNALRIIFKVKLIDKVSIEILRNKAKINSVEARMKELLLRYFEQAQMYQYPLINTMIDEYWTFRKRMIKIVVGNPDYNNELNKIHHSSEKLKTILCMVNMEDEHDFPSSQPNS